MVQGYDVKAKQKVEIQNPHRVQLKNGRWAIKGTSKKTGIGVFKITTEAEAKKFPKK